MFVEEAQNTFVRDEHSNMAIACAGRDGSDPGHFAAMFPDLADNRASRRPGSHELSRRPSDVQRRDSLTLELARLKSIAHYQHSLTGAPSIFHMAGMDAQSAAQQEMMSFSKVTLWAEYFNNMRKCWEPLLEKLVATVLYEKVRQENRCAAFSYLCSDSSRACYSNYSPF